MAYSTQKCAVWSYRVDGEDVVSQIMWGFLLRDPQIDLHLHLEVWRSQRQLQQSKGDNLFSLLRYVVGRTAEPQTSLNNPPRMPDPHCVCLIVLPVAFEHLVRNLGCVRAPSWTLLNTEQKMGSMWEFPLFQTSANQMLSSHIYPSVQQSEFET